MNHVILLGVTELGSLNDDTGIALEGLIAHFGANVFSFSVAIGPNEQDFRILGLLGDVFRDGFLVLQRSVAKIALKGSKLTLSIVITVVASNS